MGKRKTPNERTLDAIRNHPETVEIKIGGEKMLFLLCGRGARLAREGGQDPIPAIFKTLARLAPAVQRTGLFAGGTPDESKFTPDVILSVLTEAVTGEFFEDLTVVIWWGVLAAQPEVTLEEIEVLVTPAGLRTLVSSVWPKMLSYSQDLNESDLEEAAADSTDGEAGGTEGN